RIYITSGVFSRLSFLVPLHTLCRTTLVGALDNGAIDAGRFERSLVQAQELQPLQSEAHR
ncbi:MAG TPA: hypothetical protein VGS41_18445, partial [Chthonomonadales bacterium]|nr:hypothetical protein [Chthonomonadales bacterium]